MPKYNKIEVNDLDKGVIFFNEMDFIQHIEMLDVIDDIKKLNIIVRYNKYTLLLKSGIIYDCVRYLQVINPTYSVRKLPDINLEFLTNTVGTRYTYEKFLNNWPKENGSREEAVYIVANFMVMVNIFDNAKPSLMGIEIIDIFSKIIEEFCKVIINDITIATNNRLPHFNMHFNRFLTGTLPIYSVGQYLIEKEFPTKSQYWKTLRLELYNALYNLDEMGASIDVVNDGKDRIKLSDSYQSIPSVMEDKHIFSKGYLTIFDYAPNELERIYEGTIGKLNNVITMLNSETQVYDNTIIDEQQCAHRTPIEDISVSEVLIKLVSQIDEIHGIISEMYRVITKIEAIGRDKLDFGKPIAPEIVDHNKLFSVVTNLAIYLSIARLSLSLIYGRTIEASKPKGE